MQHICAQDNIVPREKNTEPSQKGQIICWYVWALNVNFYKKMITFEYNIIYYIILYYILANALQKVTHNVR